MKRRMGRLAVALVVGAAASVLVGSPTRPVRADEARPDPGVERARAEVKKLDDLYKTAVVGITETYVEKQVDTPAATVAKALFEAMHQKGYHTAKLLDATGKPKSKKNTAQTAFEKKVVTEARAGKKYVDEVGEKDGKRVYRAGTVVPAVMKQCVLCHGGKEGDLLGVLVYEVDIK